MPTLPPPHSQLQPWEGWAAASNSHKSSNFKEQLFIKIHTLIKVALG